MSMTVSRLITQAHTIDSVSRNKITTVAMKTGELASPTNALRHMDVVMHWLLFLASHIPDGRQQSSPMVSLRLGMHVLFQEQAGW